MENTAEGEEATQNLCDLIQTFKEHFHSGLWEDVRGKSLSELTLDALGRSMQIPKHCQIAGVGQAMLGCDRRLQPRLVGTNIAPSTFPFSF